jgi:hypothetical protein
VVSQPPGRARKAGVQEACGRALRTGCTGEKHARDKRGATEEEKLTSDDSYTLYILHITKLRRR